MAHDSGRSGGTVKVVHTGAYRIDIGPHVFPTEKYDGIRAWLLAAGVASRSDFLAPEPASWEDLALVHTADYLDKVRGGELTPEEIARLEMPWSRPMVEGFRLMAGGTVLCARLALAETPGTARAQTAPARRRPTSAAGSITRMPTTARASACSTTSRWPHARCSCRARSLAWPSSTWTSTRATARRPILGRDPAVFTCSLHQEHNYPADKPPSSLDCGLDDGAGDREYLEALGGRPAAGVRVRAGRSRLRGRRRSVRGRSARRPPAHPLRLAATRPDGVRIGTRGRRPGGRGAGRRLRPPTGGHGRHPRRDDRGSAAAERERLTAGGPRLPSFVRPPRQPVRGFLPGPGFTATQAACR